MSGSLTISISGTPERLRSIEVHSAAVGKAVVQALAGVFFQVHAGDADALGAVRSLDVDVAVFGQRLVVLRDLVALGQVGIEVILAGEDRRLVGSGSSAPLPPAPRTPPHAGSAPAARRAVPRQTGQTLVFGGSPKWVEQPQKDLGRGEELDVDFESDDRLIFGLRSYGSFRGRHNVRL